MSAPPSLSPTLRPARPEDRPFLREVYASTRLEELAPVPWTEPQKLAFLAQQFDAQDRDYRGKFPAETFQVIELAGRPIGRIYLHRTPEELELVDIALLPAHRGRGFGRHLLGELLAESERTQRPVRLYVEKFNPALAWYRRLGFVEIGDFEVYLKLERPPSARRA